MAVGMKPGALEAMIHLTNDVSELLKEDDSLLRQTFFTILRQHHPTVASKLDVIYELSKSWGSTESAEDFELLEKKLSNLEPHELILVCLSLNWFPSGSSWRCYAQDLCHAVWDAGVQCLLSAAEPPQPDGGDHQRPA